MNTYFMKYPIVAIMLLTNPYTPESQAQGTWSSLVPLPVSTGEVACGVIDGVLYLVGEGHSKTLAYDIVSNTWTDTSAVRHYVGHHHAAEVVGGKLYLLGGLGAGAGKVQSFDPMTNSWSVGPDMPWSGGSVSTSTIGGKIYAAGGITGSTTVDSCAVFDPVGGSWTLLASMPFEMGRNHTASATDGMRFYVFGGRGIGSGPGNWVANGFAHVQVYDPLTNVWSTSIDSASGLVGMPIGRGGMGKAVYRAGEFYIFGGETLTGPGAMPGNVYDRVDIYNPITAIWRLEAPMPTPRHGVFPVMYGNRIFLAGGGVVAGASTSSVCEVLEPEVPLPIQLSTFVGRFINRLDVQLDWTTVSELGNFGFYVQQALHPVSYETIPGSFVPGHGTTNIPQHYSFVVTGAPPIAFYRLKQIDTDGTIWYSDGIRVSHIPTIVQSDFTTSSVYLSQNYPNPFNAAATSISFTVPYPMKVRLEVYTALGELVQIVLDREIGKGDHRAFVDATEYSSGVYIYRLVTPVGALSHRMVVIR